MIFFTDNVPADIPPINIHTAIEAVRVLGKYPIADNLNKININLLSFTPFDEWIKAHPEADIII